MSKIKLFKIGELDNGTQRFQSQLQIMIDKHTADFIMRTDGVMKCWGHKDVGGFDFYEYNEPYEIVSSKADMATQQL